jgi:hypothetical protein
LPALIRQMSAHFGFYSGFWKSKCLNNKIPVDFQCIRSGMLMESPCAS